MPRPKKERSKSVIICFRVNKKQKEILEMIADYGGVELSELLRMLVQSLIYRFKTGLPIVFYEVDEYDKEKAKLSLSKGKES